MPKSCRHNVDVSFFCCLFCCSTAGRSARAGTPENKVQRNAMPTPLEKLSFFYYLPVAPSGSFGLLLLFFLKINCIPLNRVGYWLFWMSCVFMQWFMCNLSTETLLRSDLLLPMSIKGIVFRAMDVQGITLCFPPPRYNMISYIFANSV